MAEIADPAAVRDAVKLGVGAAFDGMVGGKTDKAHGDPVRVRGKVKTIHDGIFMDTAWIPRFGTTGRSTTTRDCPR